MNLDNAKYLLMGKIKWNNFSAISIELVANNLLSLNLELVWHKTLKK